jgi:RNA polymerase sigma factor (sigma-70 family)
VEVISLNEENRISFHTGLTRPKPSMDWTNIQWDLNSPLNEVSFKQLFFCFYPRVVKQLNYLVKDRELAEDLAQETFLKLYQLSPSQLENPGGWLAKVAQNLAYNYLRGEKKRWRRELNTQLKREQLVVSPEDFVSRKQEMEEVRSILELLPERDRACLILKFSGYSYNEIAETVGVHKNSVGTILARAQRKFKEIYLKQKGSGEDVF